MPVNLDVGEIRRCYDSFKFADYKELDDKLNEVMKELKKERLDGTKLPGDEFKPKIDKSFFNATEIDKSSQKAKRKMFWNKLKYLFKSIFDKDFTKAKKLIIDECRNVKDAENAKDVQPAKQEEQIPKEPKIKAEKSKSEILLDLAKKDLNSLQLKFTEIEPKLKDIAEYIQIISQYTDDELADNPAQVLLNEKKISLDFDPGLYPNKELIIENLNNKVVELKEQKIVAEQNVKEATLEVYTKNKAFVFGDEESDLFKEIKEEEIKEEEIKEEEIKEELDNTAIDKETVDEVEENKDEFKIPQNVIDAINNETKCTQFKDLFEALFKHANEVPTFEQKGNKWVIKLSKQENLWITSEKKKGGSINKIGPEVVIELSENKITFLEGFDLEVAKEPWEDIIKKYKILASIPGAQSYYKNKISNIFSVKLVSMEYKKAGNRIELLTQIGKGLMSKKIPSNLSFDKFLKFINLGTTEIGKDSEAFMMKKLANHDNYLKEIENK